MTAVVVVLDRCLLRPAPAERLAAVRILSGAYAVVFLVARLPGLLQVTRLPAGQFEPVGALVWASSPLPAGVAQLVLAATIVVGVAFAAGWRWRTTGPAFAVAFLAVTTYRASFGHVLHTDHLPALHLLVLGFAARSASDAWSLDARRRARPTDDLARAEHGWVLSLMGLLTVLTYVLAGWAKVRNGGMDWLVGDVLRNQIAFDNLRKVLLGDLHSPVGGWLVRFGWLFPPMAMMTVVVELGAPLALLGGRWRTAWVAAAWSFHVGIVALMAISFPYELSGIAYASMLPAERVVGPVLARLGGRGHRADDEITT